MHKIRDFWWTCRAICVSLGALAVWGMVLAHPSTAFSDSLIIVDASEDPLTLHPHRSFDPNSDVIISQIFEGLVDYDSDGQLVPRLAVGWQRKSPTRYRFWLREDVTFHNGEPFDAYAVRSSIEHQFRGQDRAANSWLFDPEFQAEVVDKYTVDLVTGQPDSRLPYTLPMFVKILPPKYLQQVGDDGLARRPVGTGPYQFERWERGHGVVLKANSSYWQKDLPRIKDVTFLFLPRSEQVTALIEGRADLVTKLRGNDTFRVMAAKNTRVLKRQVAAVFWVAMKNFDSPFADPRVRRAMNYAVNKGHIIQYVEKGNALRVSTMTNPIERNYDPRLQPYPFDPIRAKNLLAEAGFAHGFAVRALASEETEEMMRAIQAQLKMVGVTLDLTIVPREEYLRWTIVPKLKTGKPKFDGDVVAWLTPNPTLDAFFVPGVIFCSKSPYSIMNAPGFDELYDSCVREVDPTLRREWLSRLQNLMLSEAYGIYTSQRVQTYGLRRNLQIVIHPSGMVVGNTLAKAYWEVPTTSMPAKALEMGSATPSEGRNHEEDTDRDNR